MDKNSEKRDRRKTQEEIDRELQFWQDALKKENRMLKSMIDSLKALEEKLSVDKRPPSNKI